MSRDLVHSLLDKISRAILAAVFISAAVTKIQDPALFAHAMNGYAMLPDFTVGIFALTLPMVELLAGLALLFTKWSREATLVLLGLLGVFFIGLTQAFIRGLDISCGCFGEGETTGRAAIGLALIRDIVLFLPAVWLVRRPNAWIWQGPARLAGIVLLALSPLCLLFGRSDTPPPSAPQDGPSEGMVLVGGTNAVSALEFDDLPFSGTVQPEQWTTNFPAALAQARAEHRPILLYSGAENCEYCRRLLKVLQDKAFRHWIHGTGIYLAYGLTPSHKEGDSFTLPQLVQYVRTFPISANHNPGIPHIGVYWPREGTNTVRVAFTGRSNFMPGNARTKPLLEQFTNAIRFLLPDYFNARRTPSLKKALSASSKHIDVAAKGPGTVTMSPASGELKDGHFVTLKAKPAPGARFVHWTSPSGKTIKKRGITDVKTLKLDYNASAGIYTAVFKKK